MGSTLRPCLALVVLLSGCSAQFTAFDTDTAPVIVDEPLRPSAISFGYATSWYIVDGALWGAGASTYGELGFVSDQPTTTPVLIDDAQNWREVAGGDNHACALADTGTVHCWGRNTEGQLGLGDRENRTERSAVELPAPAEHVYAGFETSCAAVGVQFYCWGYNRENGLAQTDRLGQDILTPVPMRPKGATRFVALGVGQGHVCGITDTGIMQCAGRNTTGELGQANPPLQQSVELVNVTDTTNWTAVVGGQNYTCALRTSATASSGSVRDDKELWCWGANNGRMFGNAAGINAFTPPTRIGDRLWRTLATNTFHLCVRDANAELWCSGRGNEGQLGLGDVTGEVTSLTMARAGVGSFATGRFHTGAIGDDGSLYVAGANESGELGLGTTERARVFTLVHAP